MPAAPRQPAAPGHIAHVQVLAQLSVLFLQLSSQPSFYWPLCWPIYWPSAGPSAASSTEPTPAQAPLAERGQVMLGAEVVDALVSAMEDGVAAKITKVKEEENTARKEVERLKAEKERGEKELTEKKRHLTKCIKNHKKTCTIPSHASTAPSINRSTKENNFLVTVCSTIGHDSSSDQSVLI